MAESRRRILLGLAVAGALAAGFPASRAADGAAPPLSPAQAVLFEGRHLANVTRAERLEYRFRREAAAAEASFEDAVLLDVRLRQDGRRDVWVDFLSGARHVPFPPMMAFEGNPVLMYFLERDVEEMRRITGGAATYFRNRIRRAFLDGAELREIALEGGGPATEITVVPFRGDARVGGFPGLAEKRYRFVLSELVPGTVHEIATEVPGENGGTPRLRESITFTAERDCATAEGPCAPPRLP